MISVRLILDKKNYIGFEIKGHSGFDEFGKDIVCAAVSSAAIMTVNTVDEIIKAKAEEISRDGYVYFCLLEDNVNAQVCLKGFAKHMTALSKEYPQNIKIIYGGKA